MRGRIFRNSEIFAPTLKNDSRNTLFPKNSPRLWILSLYVLVTSSLTLILTIEIKLNTKKSKIAFILRQYSLKFIKKCAQDLVSYFWEKHTKDSKDFACSMLSLLILSRALISKNLRWARSTLFASSAPHFQQNSVLRYKIV